MFFSKAYRPFFVEETSRLPELCFSLQMMFLQNICLHLQWNVCVH